MHVRSLRRPRAPGNPTHRPSHTQPIPGKGCSSLPIIGRRLPASSSFVLAPRLPARALRALQLDPGPRDGTNRQRRGKATNQSRPAPAASDKGHRAKPARPLDTGGPHGCGYLFPVMGQVRNVAGHSHGGASPSRTCPYVHAERRHSGRQASDRSPYRFAGTQNSRGRHGVLRRLEGQPWLRTGPGSAALHLVHHDQYRAALHRCLPVAEDGEKHPQHQDASGDEQDVAGQLEKADGGSDLRAPGRADQQDGADAGRRAEKRQEE